MSPRSSSGCKSRRSRNCHGHADFDADGRGACYGCHPDQGKENGGKSLFFKLTKVLSVVYLVVVSLTVLLRPFSALPPVKLMNISNYWLAPMQGLTTAALGAFFVKQEIK